MSGYDFDQLIKDGKTAEALRYFANEGYENGAFGFTRKQLIEHAAELAERVQELEDHLRMANQYVEKEREINVMIKMQNKRYSEHLKEITNYMEYDAEIMLTESDRLKGIDKVLRKHYALESEK